MLEWIRVPDLINNDQNEPPAAHLLAELDAEDNLILSQALQLGRTKSECLKWLRLALQKQVNVYMVAENWQFELSLSSDLFVKILAAVVAAETELVREQTKEALAARKRAGVKLGRPKGSYHNRLDRYRFEIEALLATGVEYNYVGQRYGTTDSNLRRWAKQRGLQKHLR